MSLLKKEYQVKDLIIDDEYDTVDSDATIVDVAKKNETIRSHSFLLKNYIFS